MKEALQNPLNRKSGSRSRGLGYCPGLGITQWEGPVTSTSLGSEGRGGGVKRDLDCAMMTQEHRALDTYSTKGALKGPID
jgi:hypothetical protein